VKIFIGLGLVAAFLLAWGWVFLVEPAVKQPIEFPHKAHLELKDPKFECTTCHDRAEKGRMAGRPSTKKCLSCHSVRGTSILYSSYKRLLRIARSERGSGAIPIWL